jgi:hypothetical protein
MVGAVRCDPCLHLPDVRLMFRCRRSLRLLCSCSGSRCPPLQSGTVSRVVRRSLMFRPSRLWTRSCIQKSTQQSQCEDSGVCGLDQPNLRFSDSPYSEAVIPSATMTIAFVRLEPPQLLYNNADTKRSEEFAKQNRPGHRQK